MKMTRLSFSFHFGRHARNYSFELIYYPGCLTLTVVQFYPFFLSRMAESYYYYLRIFFSLFVFFCHIYILATPVLRLTYAPRHTLHTHIEVPYGCLVVLNILRN